MKIGALLQACRERAGLSQEEIADRLHTTQSTISRIERNRQSADLPTIVEWVDTTKSREVAVAYIFGMEGIEIINHILKTEARV